MLRGWKLVSWLGLGCLATLGCADAPKRATIKLPKEEFHVPPEGLFNGPIKYPKELLNNVDPIRKKDDEDKFPPAGGSPGGMTGPGMGGAGMGGAPH